uniref:MIP18 family-like domain-containing protein n=1 Tax=Pavo cristatus TaxID=9049 RepID=A0A8C9EZD5_PAVCR
MTSCPTPSTTGRSSISCREGGGGGGFSFFFLSFFFFLTVKRSVLCQFTFKHSVQSPQQRKPEQRGTAPSSAVHGAPQAGGRSPWVLPTRVFVFQQVNDAESTVAVEFTPTIPHCSMATLIGLSIKVKLIRSLPERFKMDVHITPGTHASEHAVNKQLADKERVAAALENSHLLEVGGVFGSFQMK